MSPEKREQSNFCITFFARITGIFLPAISWIYWELLLAWNSTSLNQCCYFTLQNEMHNEQYVRIRLQTVPVRICNKRINDSAMTWCSKCPPPALLYADRWRCQWSIADSLLMRSRLTYSILSRCFSFYRSVMHVLYTSCSIPFLQYAVIN